MVQQCRMRGEKRHSWVEMFCADHREQVTPGNGGNMISNLSKQHHGTAGIKAHGYTKVKVGQLQFNIKAFTLLFIVVACELHCCCLLH